MKLKEQKKFGILWLSIGAALFLAGLLLGRRNTAAISAASAAH